MDKCRDSAWWFIEESL